MNGIAFMTANYVARPLGWNMTEGWGQGDQANQDYFRPIATFGARLDEYLTAAKQLGFDAIDMWTGVLHPDWATPQHLEIAQDLLRQHDLKVYSIAGAVGSTEDQLVAVCEMATALGATVLAGMSPLVASNRGFLVATLQKYGLRLGIENHPEKTPAEVLAKIGDGGDGTIGTTIDTGWWGTQGYDAADAIAALADHLVVVHLKDVREVGKHETCRFGEGVVPIERCVRVMQEIGYSGTIAIEHEPELFDPGEDIAASLKMLKGWLGQ